MVRTHSPGNVGAAARAAKNFGARLLLIQLNASLDHPDARAFASGAEDILDNAPQVGEWATVEKEHDLLVALTSARGRNARGLPPLATLSRLKGELRSGRRVGLVFGPERSGLTTEEVLRCQARLRLSTVPEFPTMNLAQAIAASLALLSVPGPIQMSVPVIHAPTPTMRRLEAGLRGLLEKTSFPVRRSRPDVIDEVTSVLKRAEPSQREVELMLAAIAAIERRITSES